VGYRGNPSEPRAILLKHNGLHVEIQIDNRHYIDRADIAGVADVLLEAAITKTAVLIHLPRALMRLLRLRRLHSIVGCGHECEAVALSRDSPSWARLSASSALVRLRSASSAGCYAYRLSRRTRRTIASGSGSFKTGSILMRNAVPRSLSHWSTWRLLLRI
jgi:hypothetical protein